MTERTPYSNAQFKKRAAARHNARYEAKRNRHRVEPLFRYIERLCVPDEVLAHQDEALRRREKRAKTVLTTHLGLLAASVAVSAGGTHDR
tara:strand:- start:945 stop:1214 length:270 start_codon:yes stop_codon:yes gene_type:complete